MDSDEPDAWDAMDDQLDGFAALEASRKPGASGVRMFTLIPKRAFDYTFLIATRQQTVVIRRALAVPRFYYYWLALRIHNKDIASGNFTLQLFETLPSAQDPQEFSAASPSMSLQCLAGDAPPTVKTTTTTNLGPYFKVTLLATQGGVTGDKLYAELSAVLYARPA
jgi:hypothetical protein